MHVIALLLVLRKAIEMITEELLKVYLEIITEELLKWNDNRGIFSSNIKSSFAILSSLVN